MNVGAFVVDKINSYIKDNIDNLTCSDLSSIYFDLIQSISKLGGNPDNITGLTEFIVHRVLHYLNESKVTEKMITINSKGKLGSRQPDIIINNSIQPLYSIQIKSNYYKVKEDFDRHMEVKETFPLVKIITIAFEVRDPKHLKHIEKYKSINSEYQCLILKNNHQLIKDAFGELRLII